MKMMTVQKIRPDVDDSLNERVLDLFEKYGAPEGTSDIWVSVDGRTIFVLGDYDSVDEWAQIGQMYGPVFESNEIYPLVSDIPTHVQNIREGIAARS